LLSDDLFQKWASKEISTLLVVGMPGAGKSYLATIVIKHMQDQSSGTLNGLSVAYYYIKNDQKHLLDLKVMLKTMAYQIADVNTTYRSYIASICKDSNTLIDAQEIWEVLFHNFFSNDRFLQHSAFLIIDGLDEAPSEMRSSFVALIESFHNGKNKDINTSRLSFAIFGRPEILEDFHIERSRRVVQISANKNSEDIERFVTANIRKIEIFRKLNRNQGLPLARKIKTIILSKSDGMFLWARLVMEQLYKRERVSDIEHVLESVPRDLDKMIYHVFARLASDEDGNYDDLNRILLWVTYAQRPLTLGAIDLLLFMPTREYNPLLQTRVMGKYASLFRLTGITEPEIDMNLSNKGQEDNLHDPYDPTNENSDPLDYLDSLDDATLDAQDFMVSIEDEPDMTESESKVDERHAASELAFSHQQIREFLVKEGSSRTRSFDPVLPIGIDVINGQIEIMKTYLNILCNEVREGVNEKPWYGDLVSHARHFWLSHLKAIKISDTPQASRQDLALKLCTFFHEEPSEQLFYGSMNMNELRETWFYTMENTSIIREWLATIDLTDSCVAGDMKTWLEEVIKSTKNLLKPAV